MADINSISPDIRDFLLNRNLILADTITDNGMVGWGSGLGKPANIETPPNAVQPSDDIETLGSFYRGLNIINNPYQDDNPPQQIDITSQNIGNIGNLPAGTPPAPYGTYGVSADESKLLQDAEEQRLHNTKFNQYLDADQQVVINLQNKSAVSNQTKGYIDENNNLNTGGAVGDQPLNILGSVLTGRGIGFNSQGGVEPNFDIRGSLAGRVLNAAGAINDTPLGTIGGQQLAYHLGINAAFGLQQETIGNINTNPLSLLQGNSIIVPNYNITVPQGETGRVLDFGAKVLGFNLPVSTLSNNSSIFYSENPVGNILRANEMIKNTGRGQVMSLFSNLRATQLAANNPIMNRYTPPFSDERVDSGDGSGLNGDMYVDINRINEGLIGDNSSFLNEETRFSEQFQGLSVYGANATDKDGEFEAASKFSWESGEFEGNDGTNITNRTKYFDDVFVDQKSLLYKTQQMFKTNKIRTMVSGKGSKADYNSIEEVATAVQIAGGKWTSKGSGVLSQAAIDGEVSPTDGTSSEVFCRVWTTFDRYNKIKDLQKNDALFGNAGLRFSTGESVLQDNGMPRIAPYVGEHGPDDMKRFMLSIENLAWHDKWSSLPECEKGPGDPLTGTRGRIMWFPPYDINFTDNSSVNLDTTNFIGRGEPVYTYNNTERTGTLQFKVIIDHAAYMNELKNRSDIDDNILHSIAAGCYELPAPISTRLSQEELDEIAAQTQQKPEEINTPKAQTPPDPFTFYFPNDVATLPTATSIYSGYETGKSTHTNVTGGTSVGLGCTKSEKFHGGGTNAYPDETDFGLNAQTYSFGITASTPQTTFEGWTDPGFAPALKDYMTNQCPACKVKIYAGTSTDGNTNSNNKLGLARAASVKKWFEENIFVDDKAKEKRFELIDGKLNVEQGCSKSEPCKRKNQGIKGPCNNLPNQCQDLRCKKIARDTSVEFVYSPEIDKIINPKPKGPTAEELQKLALNDKIRSRFFSECSYFEKLEQNDSFIFSTLKRKIRYFHPAFHSTTPEGFNARLTFLKQCTRQGPTEGRDGIPSNLAFGMAPVCILRVGDFYHTKILMENVNFSFDPIVWDLNPEGVGVQPMICNVDISFKFIGGSSLAGPINKLQNAVSFNFFANTEIYDTRADKIEFKEDKAILVEGRSPTQLDDTEDEATKDGLGSNVPQGETNQEAELEENLVNEDEQTPAGEDTGDPVKGQLTDPELKVLLYYNGENGADTVRVTIEKPFQGARTPFFINKDTAYRVRLQINNKQTEIASGKVKVNPPNGVKNEKGDLTETVDIDIDIPKISSKLTGTDENTPVILQVDFGDGIIKTAQPFCLWGINEIKEAQADIFQGELGGGFQPLEGC